MFVKRILLTALAAFVLTTAFAAAQRTIPQMRTSTAAGEKAIASYFVEDSVGDVQLGELGLKKSTDSGVRDLANAMVHDHTATANAGMQVAKAVGDDDVKWQSSDDNQMTLTRLAGYHGTQFDREYVKALVQAHETDIGVAQDALDFSSSPAVQRYLQQTLRVDRKHLRIAQSLQSKV